MKVILTAVILMLSISAVMGQGCSDAGFCSMGAMRPSQVYTKKLNFKLRALEFTYYNGKSTLSPKISVATLDFTFGITEKTNFQVKVPYQWVNGNLGNTSGLADLSLSLTHNVFSTEKYHINATMGTKIPTNQSNLDQDVKSDFLTTPSEGRADLPMYYQTSLGTYDLVIGASLITKNWMFAAGVQAPLAHNNKNEFSWLDWANYPSQEYLLDNPLARHLKRGTDIMIRAERAFHFSNLDIRLGVLPIYRITQDQILNASGEYVKLDGTTGLALTTLLHVAYHFNTKHSVKFLYGKKLTDRDLNPDGLTRAHVVSMSYVITF